MSLKVYFISGLGADGRIFKNIILPEGHEMVHLDWIPPITGESLSHYARRLGEKIDQSEPFALAGLSMGGMMASEIAAFYKPAHTILISSVPSHEHLPGYFKIFWYLKMHRMVPVRLVKRAAIAKRLFTSETSGDKKVLYDVIRDSDPVFMKWAMEAVLTWKTIELPANYIHIHGTRDEVLPMRYTKPTHILKGAGHMMVMTRAREVNRILGEILTKTI